MTTTQPIAFEIEIKDISHSSPQALAIKTRLEQYDAAAPPTSEAIEFKIIKARNRRAQRYAKEFSKALQVKEANDKRLTLVREFTTKTSKGVENKLVTAEQQRQKALEEILQKALKVAEMRNKAALRVQETRSLDAKKQGQKICAKLETAELNK